MPSVADLVIQSSTSTGTGNFTLASLASGSPPYFYRNFSDVFGTGAGNTFYYCIRNQSAAEFEVGIGYMSSATVMVRSSVIRSSNANALVNFSAGVKDVICDMPADYQAIKPIQHGGTGAPSADGAVRNLIANLTQENSADAAGPKAIYGYYHTTDDVAYYVSGELLTQGVVANGGFGALAFQSTANLATQVTGDLPFSNIAQIATAQFLGRNTAGTGDVETLSTTTAKTMLGYQVGVATDEVIITQSISGLSTFTQNIALASGTWTNGKMIVTDTTTGNTASGAIIHFTDTVAQSSGLSGSILYNSYLASLINTLQVAMNQFNGRVTSTGCFMGAASASGGTIRIDSVRISGTNLEIIWRNGSAVTQTINARIRYYLMRGDKVTP